MDDNRIIDLFFERSEKAISELALKYGGVCLKVLQIFCVIIRTQKNALMITIWVFGTQYRRNDQILYLLLCADLSVTSL